MPSGRERKRSHAHRFNASGKSPKSAGGKPRPGLAASVFARRAGAVLSAHPLYRVLGQHLNERNERTPEKARSRPRLRQLRSLVCRLRPYLGASRQCPGLDPVRVTGRVVVKSRGRPVSGKSLPIRHNSSSLTVRLARHWHPVRRARIKPGLIQVKAAIAP